MRKILLALILCCAVAMAEPVVTRVDGQLGNLPVAAVGRDTDGRVVRLKGKYFQGEVEIGNHFDLRDARQLEVRVALKNTSQVAAYYALYVMVMDAKGDLLGANSLVESNFAREPGKSIRHQVDLAMPQGINSRAAFYQIVLYEDKERLQP